MWTRATAIGAAVVLWQLPAAAGDPATAREQLKMGYTLAEDGKCSEALPHLLESLRLDPKAITLINLADCEEKVGKLTDALGHWVDARARARAEGQKPIEDEATLRLNALEPRVPRLTIVRSAWAPSDAVVERDGVVLGAPSMNVPLPVDPGAHSIVVKAKGRPDATTQLTLAEGESKRIELDEGEGTTVDPPPSSGEISPSPSRWTDPIVVTGASLFVVGAAVGSITGLMAMGAGSRARTDCPADRCTSQELDSVETGRTVATVSTVAFIAAGAGVALGVYGYFRGGKKTDPSVAVSFSPTGIGMRGRF
jgi:hypothetical protein